MCEIKIRYYTNNYIVVWIIKVETRLLHREILLQTKFQVQIFIFLIL